MFCLRNISVDTLHKGDTEDDDDNNIDDDDIIIIIIIHNIEHTAVSIVTRLRTG